jgi:hypothetical protein
VFIQTISETQPKDTTEKRPQLNLRGEPVHPKDKQPPEKIKWPPFVHAVELKSP